MCEGFGPRLATVGEGLVPHLAPQGLVSQPFRLFGQTGGRELFDGLDDACVQRPPPLLQHTAVGHFVGEGVLEGVGMLREEARFVEELGGLQLPQAPV